jgi:hypothetical protein
MSTDCDSPRKSWGQGRRTLTVETGKRAEELTAFGLPMLSIAQALGVNRCTPRVWIALEPVDSAPEAALAAAIQRAHGGKCGAWRRCSSRH